MKVGEQCLYLAQKGLSKAEAKKQLEYWFEKLKFKVGGTRKFKNFLKEWQKIQFVVCVLHKPKLLILTNLFWIRPREC
jgi:ABC-2 type transport system ATP-binding protein